MERTENREHVLVLGRQLGRYQVVSHLATGGMSELYVARQEAVGGFEKNLVIKVLQARYAQHTRVVGMFLDEARLAAKLNHPNIVHVYDVAEEAGNRFIAMEYIHGETLTDILKRGVEVGSFLPIEHAVHVVSQVAAGLDYAHRRHDASGGLLRIVHRDVSPSNIMVSYEGQTKIIDFGIARVQDQIREESGMHPGKASYMSPEQINGEAVDYRSDIFSLGIILYEITLARRLWRGAPEDVMKRIVGEAIAPPTTIRQDYPAALEAIVMKALEKRPDDRYQAAEEMRHDLEEFIAAVGYRTGARRMSLYLRELFPIKAALSDEGIIQPRLAGDGDSAPLPLVGADSQPGGPSIEIGGAAMVPPLLSARDGSSGSRSVYPSGMRRTHGPGTAPAEMVLAPRGPSNARLALAAALITLAAITTVFLVGRSRRPDTVVAVVTPEETPVEPARPAPEPVRAAPGEPSPPPPAAPAEGPPPPPTMKVAAEPLATPPPSSRAAITSRVATTANDRARNRRQRRQTTPVESSAHASAPAPTLAPTPAPAPVASAPESPPAAEPVVTRPAPPPPPAPTSPSLVAAQRPSPAGPAPGFVDVKAVNAVVRAHAAEVQGCFDRALMERADLHGRLTVRAALAPSGRVTSVTPTAVMEGGGRLQTCVVAAFQSWTFPAPAGGVKGTVTYSFSFE
ncbi:MAG TPA: protein kinase [Polyangia bacterium]|nr:protein kinase [Polyangia bacterium]